MSPRPIIWPDTPIDILTDEWRPGTFRRWTREGALVSTQAGHQAVVPSDAVRLIQIEVPRYLPQWDTQASGWRLLDMELGEVTKATFEQVGDAAAMAGHLNSGVDSRKQYRWTP